MITPYNLLRHELIGLRVKAHTGEATICGLVEGETSKTLKIKTPKGVEKVVKETSKLEFQLPQDAVVEVDGGLIAARPADRIKKKHRIRF